MKYDFIGIRDQAINGIKNPCVTIVGTLEKDNCSFLVLADGEKIKYTFDKVNNKGDFALFAPISFKVKNVEVYIVIGKEKYLISNLKNGIFRRIKIKIARQTKNSFRPLIRFFNKLLKIVKYIFVTIYKGVRLAWKEHHFLIPPALWPKYYRALKVKLRGGVENAFYNPFIAKEYNKWIKEQKSTDNIESFKYNPLISIAIPVYNIEREFLKDCLDSILNQTYKNFEICLADDCSTKEETIKTLEEYAKKDSRVKVFYRKENGHISKATNSAIDIACGEYIALMDDDDVITPDALYEMVKALNNNPKLDMIYSDEDKMEMDGTLCDPHFKPDFAPDTLFGGNYICHFSLYRTSIIKKIGGFRSEFVGAQDYDLVLRFTEQTNNIYHIPKILYHWRKVPGSTAVTIDSKGYAIENGRRAVEEALKRRGLKGKVYAPINSAHYIVEYDIIDNPLVSIIIPTKDNSIILKQCVDSILKKTTYKNYEIIIINNNSCEKKTFDLLNDYRKNKCIRVIDANYDFNYSRINNEAVKKAKGEYILLLNNDTKVITKNWIELMLGYAMQKHIGAVGAKLFYPDGTIQHGGVILGIGGVAAHAFPNVPGDSYGTFGRLLIPYNYSAVTAACLMVKKSKYMKVGGLDEKLAVAYNDVDFNMKLLEKGYYNIFIPMAQLYHYESKSRGLDTTTKKYKRLLEETQYIKDKWKEKIINDRFYNPNYSLGKDFMLDRK